MRERQGVAGATTRGLRDSLAMAIRLLLFHRVADVEELASLGFVSILAKEGGEAFLALISGLGSRWKITRSLRGIIAGTGKAD